MLQTNLIFGIQKKIKEGRQKDSSKMLEESAAIEVQRNKKKDLLLENYYNPGIISGIYEQVKKAETKTEHKKTLVMEAFHLTKAERKLQKDITYFNYLYENFVPEVFQKDYQMLLENIFEDTIRLYQECDVTPRVISPAIDSNELNESQIVDLYKNALNKSIKDNYTKPLLSGKINELFESEIRVLTKKLLQENVVTDTDQVRIYLPFEETLYRFNREVMIPKTAQSRMESFMESVTEEYTDLLEETAQDIIKSIEQKIKLLTSMVSPDMFNKAVDAEGVDAPKMAGISITVDKNFDGMDPSGDIVDDCGDEEGPCTADAEADPEAAEELANDAEAEEIDAAGEDIVGAEEDAKDSLGQASNSEDLESSGAENRAELSAAEASGEDDQPGAIESDLPSQAGSINTSGSATNDSDVGLQGSGNDSGEDAGSVGATLPGSSVSGSTTEVNDDDEGLSSANDTGTSDGSVSLPGSSGTTASSAADFTNNSDVGLQGSGNANGETTSSGSASLPGGSTSGATSETNASDTALSNGVTAASTGSVSAEVVGADGDDSNEVLGVSAEAPEEEVNTETPSEDEMNKVEKIEDSMIPRL